MRPVDKRYPPHDPPRVTRDGVPRRMHDVMRSALQDTIGPYCSFCEMPAYSGDVIASKRTKKLRATPALPQWEDLLLTCDFCRMHRRGDVANPADYLWPDVDATFSLDDRSPFRHATHEATFVVTDVENGAPLETHPVSLAIVEVNERSPDAERARRTLELFQLNSPYYDAATRTMVVDAELRGSDDRRLLLRQDAWRLAERHAARVQHRIENGPKALLDLAIESAAAIAQGAGFWSVWVTVFMDVVREPDIVRRVLVDVRHRGGYQFTGYQTIPEGGSPPWLVFPGTAVERLRIPSRPPASFAAGSGPTAVR